MEATNLYASPSSETAREGERYTPKIFSLRGRIGRVRYFAYSMLINFLFLFVVGLIAAIAIPAFAQSADGTQNPIASLFFIFIYIPLFIYLLGLAKRRLNDLNRTGWLGLLLMVPLVNIVFGLYLLFGRGTDGDNNYGPQPIENSKSIVVVGIIFPLLLVAILAAVAIPAYQGYVERAQQAQVQ
jgi:uncharacterized membrane protein YhaH (DUF805 family)